MRNYLKIIVCFLLFSHVTIGQSFDNYLRGIKNNPSVTGLNNNNKIIVDYTDKSRSANNSSGYFTSIEKNFESINSAVGIWVESNIESEFRRNKSLNLNYVYQINLSEKICLRPAVSGGISFYNESYHDGISYFYSNEKGNNLQFSPSLLLYHKNFSVGASYQYNQLNQEQNTNIYKYNNYNNLMVNIGFNSVFKTTKPSSLQGILQYKALAYNTAYYTEKYELNLIYKYNNLTIGIGEQVALADKYSFLDTGANISAMVGYKYKNIEIIYSYHNYDAFSDGLNTCFNGLSLRIEY